MNLVKCSCGFETVQGGLGDAGTDIAVKLALMDIGFHWSEGHKVTVASIEVWVMVRHAAIVYARAQGIDVNAINVPANPKENRPPRPYAGVDDLRFFFDELHRRNRNRRRW